MRSSDEAADCQVAFQPIGKRVCVKAGTTLLDAARSAGLLLSASCGGVGVCGKCRVTVVKGEVSTPSQSEQNCLGTDLESGVRLACETLAISSLVVDVPPASLGNGQRLQVDGVYADFPCDALVEVHQLVLDAPKLNDSRSDYRRVADALVLPVGVREWTIQPGAASQLSRLARANGWELTAYSRGNELIGFSAARRPAVGLAVDIGCTKIAAYLVDLKSGAQLAACGAPNPQLSYGEDLITRLVFAAKSAAQGELMATLVRQAINDLAAELCAQAKVFTHEIADVCIVGNTAMEHLLLQMPVEQLLFAPYISSIDCVVDIGASELSLDCAPGAQVHVLPSIGGFVGADHVAMILAHGIDRADKVTIGIDIGTNTEIVLHNPRNGAFVATSAPSGPAFEGGHLSNGMRAASGAIDKVFFVDGKLQFRTIDGEAPIGICGSGIVDLVAELWRLNCIDERGHLMREGEGVRSGEHGLEFLVIPDVHSACEHDIVVTQHDITEIQLAKAAISAGIATLMEVTGTEINEVEEMVVAGAFGTYLDLRSAVTIGLLPRLPNARYSQIGNAAGAGAKLALISRAAREQARLIARRVTRIELKQQPNFNRLLARATRFPAHLNEGSRVPATP